MGTRLHQILALWVASNYFFFIPKGAIYPPRVLLLSARYGGTVGKGWGNWSGRGSNLLPLAQQRSKQVVFHLCMLSVPNKSKVRKPS